MPLPFVVVLFYYEGHVPSFLIFIFIFHSFSLLFYCHTQHVSYRHPRLSSPLTLVVILRFNKRCETNKCEDNRVKIVMKAMVDEAETKDNIIFLNKIKIKKKINVNVKK